MAAEKKYPVSLVVRAVDKASGTLKGMTSRIAAITGPFARKEFGKNLSALGEALNVDGFMKVGGALKNVGSQVWSLATRFAGLAVGAGVVFGAIVKGAMDAGDSLAEHAERVGLSIDSYASLRYAAEQADVPQEMFATSLDKLNKQMGEMTHGKGGKFLHFLNEISPTFATQVKGAKTTEEAFFLLTDAMALIPDSQRRADLAAAAFGKSNAQMGVFMHQGTAAILEQEREFIRLFGSQEKSARAAGELDNATRRTETAMLGLRMAVAGALFPALARLSNLATEFLVKHRDGLERWATSTGAAIDRWVTGGGLDRLGAQLVRVADGVMKVVDFLGPMGVAVVAAGVMFAPLILSIASLGVALIGVMPTLIAFGVAIAPLLLIVGVGAAIGVAIWKISEGLEEAGKKFEEWADTARWAVLDVWKSVRPIFEKLALLPGLGGGFAAALAGGDFAAGQVTKSIEAHTGQSMAAIEARKPGSGQRSETAVSVSFDNMPPGARVSTGPRSTGAVDLSVGYSVQP